MKNLEARIKSDIEDMLSRNMTIKFKDNKEIKMYVSKKVATYSKSELQHLGFHNRDNQCFYARKYKLTLFCAQGWGDYYKIIGAFDGDCILADHVVGR